MQRCHDKEVHKKYKPEYADKCVCEEAELCEFQALV